jgi:glycine amidinotransferase
VYSVNEWDKLETCIVGTAKGAGLLAREPALEGVLGENHPIFTQPEQYKKTPTLIAKAEAQLDGLARLLQNEGVSVLRPRVDSNKFFQTGFDALDFSVPSQYSATCPRDLLLPWDNEIIEASMGLRGRFFEYRAYRHLVPSVLKSGGKWTCAPKGLMTDEYYTKNAVSEYFPLFDAADAVRLGNDGIYVQRSKVTNEMGIDWLRNHFKDKDIPVYTATFDDKHAMHIDTTFVPLKKGLALINPIRACTSDMYKTLSKKGWELVKAPMPNGFTQKDALASNWLSINVLSVDERTIICEEKEKSLINMLETRGFRVLQLPFDAMQYFGGGFHCATLDVRRKKL